MGRTSSRPSSAVANGNPISLLTTNRRSSTPSKAPNSGGSPTRSAYVPASSSDTLVMRSAASTEFHSIAASATNSKIHICPTSLERAAPSSPTTASAASSPTAQMERIAGATWRSSTRRRSIRLPWTPRRSRPSSTTSMPSDKERATTTRSARHGSVGLLFGPPGTGKSTMIAAISNHLEYDIYDLELTAVNDNTELRKLFIQTKGKSIIVIEDIDRSVDFTSKCKRRDKKSGDESDNTELRKLFIQKKERGEDADGTKLTLCGMLNFIDGLWSACGSERIIIFTTNNMDKLDPALIRPGRMDKHIEMSYCRFEAFKVLAKNYLDITITAHHFFELFTEIGKLLQEVDMSPAEVAGHLMRTEEEDADACLKRTEE
uniref:AAA+ ATPase domain-containing protein n=1 Tax=Triticum urartu TaxID=4572 RepID=A0A8R7VD39_TRIUA